MSWTESSELSFPPLSQKRIRFPLHRLIHPCGSPVDHRCLFHCPCYQKWAVPAIPHFTNERVTVSFSRREVSCHAVPTHFVKSTRRTSLTFPLINSCPGFVDKCSVASLSTLFLNSALNATSSGWILLVAPGGISPNVVWHSCVRMVFILSVVWALCES